MIILFTIIGLCVGSFLNVVILRMPKDQSIAFPASHCPTCKSSLKWYHNIPLFSWIFLRGRCSFCKDTISIQYPLVELLSGIIFALVFLKSEGLFEASVVACVFALLLALSVIDLHYKAVPDYLSIPALIIAFFTGDILSSLSDGLLFAGGFALLRIFVSWIIKKEAMGEADIIIAGIIGAMLGILMGLLAVYIAALIALPAFLIVSKKEFELPFIPFLAMGLLLVWLNQGIAQKIIGFIYG